MARCKQCEKNGQDHDELVELFKTDLFQFTRTFVSNWVSTDFHYPICQWLHKKKSEGKNNLCFMLERGGLKTTMLNVGLTLQRIVNNPMDRNLLVMNNEQYSRQRILYQQQIILSDKFRHFFKDIVPNDFKDIRWNRQAYDVIKPVYTEDPNVLAKSADSKFASIHCDHMLLDDLIDGTSKDISVQIEHANQFMMLAEGLWASRENSEMTILGTFWPGGFYEGILENPFIECLVLGCYADERYFSLMDELGYSTTLKKGDPLWVNKKLNGEKALGKKIIALDKAKITMGSHFAHQMENLPTKQGKKFFDKHPLFAWKDKKRKAVDVDGVYYPLRFMYKQLIIDPATGQSKKNDDSAYTISGWVKDIRAAFVFSVFRDQINPDEFLDVIINDALKWEVDIIRVEEAGQQHFFTIMLNNKLQERFVKMDVDGVSPKNISKLGRIKSLQPLTSEGRILYNPDSDSGCDILKEEKRTFVVQSGKIVSGNPNALDSLAHHQEYWDHPHTIKVQSGGFAFEMDDDDELIHTQRRLTPIYACKTRMRNRI